MNAPFYRNSISLRQRLSQAAGMMGVVFTPPLSTSPSSMKRNYSCLVALSFAASITCAAPAADKSGDDDWAALQGVVSQAVAPQKGPNAAAVMSKQVTVLVAAADQCRDFGTKHATHKRASDSQCLEAIMLTRAWQSGDDAQKGRRTSAIQKELHDKTVTPQLRAELMALVDSVTVAKTPNLSRDQILSAHADSARGLITEFPDLPVGYYTLASIARDSAETQATAIAREILAMKAAPAPAKVSAQTILDRTALVGKSLRALTVPVTGVSATFNSSAGHPTLVYSWTANDLVGLQKAKKLVAKAPAGTVVIGVCLDTQVADAKAAAATNALPGSQLYDVLGRKGALAQALKLNDTGIIYVADSAGLIRTVAAHNNPNASAAFAGL